MFIITMPEFCIIIFIKKMGKIGVRVTLLKVQCFVLHMLCMQDMSEVEWSSTGNVYYNMYVINIVNVKLIGISLRRVSPKTSD